MIGTIKEYAGHRLAEAGESDQARHAHLAHFTELTETAEPHLRRAEQLDWLASARRRARQHRCGDARRARGGRGAGGDAARGGRGLVLVARGHKTEGMELITAATRTPGEVTDEDRATVYAWSRMFVSSGRGDEHLAAEWIHEAYRFSRRSRHAGAATRRWDSSPRWNACCRAPDAFLPAWDPLLDDEDPWVRALARLHLGKMRIVLGHGGRDADAYLEKALADSGRSASGSGSRSP